MRGFFGWLLCFSLLVPASARADGALVLGDRTLQRQGEAARNYCAEDDIECRHALLRVLSGYGYFPGSLAAGARLNQDAAGATKIQPGLELRLSTLGAATPSGEIKLGTVELGGWLAPSDVRVRGTALDGRALFFCHDSQRGGVHAPVFGIMTRACSPGAVVGLELGLVEAEWDPLRSRAAVEWLRTGLGFELFANGHAHSRLSRSLILAPLVDLRSLSYGDAVPAGGPGGRFGVGTGARVGWLVRTPRWEGALDARYRMDVLQLDAATPDHQLALELRLVHNFFLTDAIVAQVGLRLSYHHAQQPLDAFGMQASATARDSGFLGLVLGWKHEPPAI